MPNQLLAAVTPLLLLLSLQQFGSAALMEAKAWLAPRLVEDAWERSLASGGTPTRPWPWADTWPVARLQVAELGVVRFVLSGNGGHALAFGPGYDPGSAALGGEGAAIIGGHRDTHFAFLRELNPGMQVELQLADNRRRLYAVAETSVVDSSNGLLPALGPGEQLLLITCYPFDAINSGGPQRFIVRLVPQGGVASQSLAAGTINRQCTESQSCVRLL